MIPKKDIRIGFIYIHRAFKMHMVLKSFSPGHESHLGMITLKAMHFTWTGSLRDFQHYFISP